MKKILLLALISFASYSQTSIGGLVGINSYTDQCATSETLGEVSLQLIQGINHSLLTRVTFNAGNLENSNVPYKTDYVLGNLDFLINANQILGFNDEKYQVLPFFGGGYGRVEDQGLYNIHGGILQKVKLTDRLWLALEVGRRGFVDGQPLGGHQGSITGMTSRQDYALVGIFADMFKRKPKKKVSNTEYVIQKIQPIVNEICCEEKPKPKESFKYVVYFNEGEPRKSDSCDALYSDKNLDQFREAQDMMTLLDKQGIKYTIEYHCYSCHNHGTPESNKELRARRGYCVFSELNKEGTIIDHEDIKYSNIAHQRSVEIIIKIID